jgi:hypothetical protein
MVLSLRPYRPITADSTDKNNLSQNGHLYKKTFQEGDDKLLLEPHRDHMGEFLYKRYRANPQGLAYLVPCSCNSYGGGLCRYCIVLNTSVFHGLEVPLNPDDWGRLKAFLMVQQKWSERQVYRWLQFWTQALDHRWDEDGKRKLIFFRHTRFVFLGNHRIFRYMAKYLWEGKVLVDDPWERKGLFPVDHNGGAIRRPTKPPQKNIRTDCVAITTSPALFRFTFQLYGKGGRVTRTETDHRKSIVYFTHKEDPRQDRFAFSTRITNLREKERWKRVFRHTVDEIQNEVRFRPGMCGMEECMSSFFASADRLNIS